MYERSGDFEEKGKEIGGVTLPFYTEEGKLSTIVNNVPQARKPFNLLCQVYSQTTSPVFIFENPIPFHFKNL
jgi:hypothetical protein